MSGESPIDRALERRLDAEIRTEMAAAEREADVLASKRRTINDVARGSVDRGDSLTVSAGGAEFSGIGVYARGDLMTLAAPSAMIEVNLSSVDWIRVDVRAKAGGRSSPVEAESFPARLGLLELTRELVTVVGRLGTYKVDGRIAAVARDHAAIVAVDTTEWFVQIAGIAFVVRQIKS